MKAMAHRVATNFGTSPRTLSMVDGSGTSSWTYDNLDQVTSLTTPQGVINYSYNVAGQKTSMTEVGTGTTSYNYDGFGRLSSLVNPFSETTSFAYDTAGRLSRKNLGNGTYEDYAYDLKSRSTGITIKGPSGNVIDAKAYTYDTVNRVTSATEGGVATSYGYDAIDQLSSEVKPGYSASYSYDANGNRLNRTVNGVAENYSYDPADKLLAVTSPGATKSYSYDAAGRTTAIAGPSGTTSFVYDYESRITQILYPGGGSDSNTYNGLDARVGSSGVSGSKTFKRDGVAVTSDLLSEGVSSFTPDTSLRLGSLSHFQHSGLMSITHQTDGVGGLTGTIQTDAFGVLQTQTGSWFGPLVYDGGFGYQSTMKGMYLVGHRYYDPLIGRFLTRDTSKDGDNWFAYCDNNPTNYHDSDGLKPKHGKGKPGKSPKPWDKNHKPYKTPLAAANAAIAACMPKTDEDGNERCGAIEKVPGGYRPGVPHKGGKTGSPGIYGDAGEYHTHPKGGPDTSDDGDQLFADETGVPVFAGDSDSGDTWINHPTKKHKIPPDSGNPRQPRTGDGASKAKEGWRPKPKEKVKAVQS